MLNKFVVYSLKIKLYEILDRKIKYPIDLEQIFVDII